MAEKIIAIAVVTALAILFHLCRTCWMSYKENSYIIRFGGFKVNKFEKRGYAGVVGAVMALIGIAMPVIDLGLFGSYSVYDYLSEEAPLMCFLYIGVLIGVGIAYACIRHKIGFFLSVPCAIYYFYTLFGDFGEDIFTLRDIFSLEIGFWFSAVGVLLMLLSPYISSKFIER